MVESLPRVEVYANAFSESTLLSDAVHDVFVSSLQFWMKACKFYRRHRLFNLIRATWNDYDVEFLRLENAMKTAVDRVEKGAIAEHIKESKVFRTEQRLILEKASELQQLDSHDELIRLLSPSTADVDYHVQDHGSAQKLRHPGTCRWILENDIFDRWSKAPIASAGPNLLLWINGGPGMGKTVLNSAIVDHLKSPGASKQHPILIYFYFNGFSSDRNNPTAAVLSFLYQILAQNEDDPVIKSKISMVFRLSSKPRFSSLWRDLCDILKKLPRVTFVLDGLDVCLDSKTFVKELRNLTKDGTTRILITSRREKHLLKELDTCESFEITPGHVQNDIKAFVEYKITRNPLLSNPVVSNFVNAKLLYSNNGMFLWVRLVLKELKACLSVEQVKQALAELPTGLEAMYSAVFQRLEKTLTGAAIDVARKVLAWAIGSARPITFDELRTALSYQYKLNGHTLLYEDSKFPYSERDIELMCGSLIVIRNGQVQPSHYTVKSYMLKLCQNEKASPGSDPSILPDLVEASLDFATVCVTYFAEKSLVLSAARDILAQSGKYIEIFKKDAFLEYSCIYWIYHALDCPINHGNDMARLLTDRFTAVVTRFWLEGSLQLDRRGLWRLMIGIEELDSFFRERKEMSDATTDVSQVCEWCAGLRSCLDNYGTSFMKSPSFVQTLDLRSFYLGKPSKSIAEPGLNDHQEVGMVLCGLGTPTASNPDFERTQLAYEEGVQFDVWKATLGFFVYDSTQDVFFSGEKTTHEPTKLDFGLPQEWLFVQQAETGRRLPPVTQNIRENTDEENYSSCEEVIATALSPDGRFFVIAYNSWFSVWIIERNLMSLQSRKATQRLTSRDWASRLMAHQYADLAKFDTSDTDAPIIAFSPENRLFVPGGWFNLPSREFCPFGPFEHSSSVALPMLFSSNVEYFYRVQKVASHQLIFQHQMNNTLSNQPVVTFKLHPGWKIKPSNTGAYFVMFGPDIEAGSVDILLMECKTSKLFKISEGKAHFGHRSFHFSKEDKQLVTFLRGPQTSDSCLAQLTVIVWELSPEGPKKRCEGSISIMIRSCSSFCINSPLFAMRSDNFAWIVTCDRTIHAVQFDFFSVSFPGRELVDTSRGFDSGGRTTASFEKSHTEISHDGSRLAKVNVRGSEVRLQILSLSGSDIGQVVTDELYKMPNTYEPSGHILVRLSCHFDTLVVESYAFIISLPNSPCIQFDIILDRTDEFCRESEWECKTSSCGTYVAFCRPGREEKDLGRLTIFGIDRLALKTFQLDFPSTREPVRKRLDIQVRSVEFHRSLPIITVTYNLAEGYKGLNFDGFPVMDLVMSTVHLTEPLAIPSPLFQCFWNSEWITETDKNDTTPGSEQPRQKSPLLRPVSTRLSRRRNRNTKLQGHCELMTKAISPGSLEPEMLVRSSVRFSDCGTFIYLLLAESRWEPTGRLLLSDIPLPQQPITALNNKTAVYSSKHRRYILKIGDGLVWVEMDEHETQPDDVGLPFYQEIRRKVTAKYITTYAERWGFYNLDAWLLLGDSYDERMRLLILCNGSDPVLKILTVSWNDVLEIFEKELAGDK